MQSVCFPHICPICTQGLCHTVEWWTFIKCWTHFCVLSSPSQRALLKFTTRACGTSSTPGRPARGQSTRSESQPTMRWRSPTSPTKRSPTKIRYGRKISQLLMFCNGKTTRLIFFLTCSVNDLYDLLLLSGSRPDRAGQSESLHGPNSPEWPLLSLPFSLPAGYWGSECWQGCQMQVWV